MLSFYKEDDFIIGQRTIFEKKKILFEKFIRNPES